MHQENREDDDRAKVAEFQEGNVVVEVYEKKDRVSGKIFFDVKHMREFTVRETGERRRSPLIQQRDLRHNVIALCRAQIFISERHREIKDSYSYGEGDG